MTPSSRPSTEQRRATRRDSTRNRQQLLDAAGDMLREDPDSVTVVAVARRAGLSPATAYRHFPSLDDLRDAYLLEVVRALRDYSRASTATGPALFGDVLREWGRLLNVHGTAMVQLRSRRGFLERLRDQDPVITAVHDAWERPIRELIAFHDDPDETFLRALMLCNALFDPREVLDLVAAGQSMEAALALLSSAYRGAVARL
jgi:AcrR family transcriptional regulator